MRVVLNAELGGRREEPLRLWRGTPNVAVTGRQAQSTSPSAVTHQSARHRCKAGDVAIPDRVAPRRHARRVTGENDSHYARRLPPTGELRRVSGGGRRDGTCDARLCGWRAFVIPPYGGLRGRGGG